MHEPPRKPGKGPSSTLVGDDWLRESPVNGSAWRVPRSKSDLRKCIYMPVPPSVLAHTSWLASPLLPPSPKPAPRPDVQEPPRRRNVLRDARMFPAYDPVVYARRRTLVTPPVAPRVDGPLRTTPRTPLALPAEHKARLRQTHRTMRSLPYASPSAAPSHAASPFAASPVALARRVGWDHPALVGLLLLVAPPVGVSVLWTSRRYGNEARIALTIMSGVTMFLAAAVAIAFAIVRHS